MNHPAGNAAGTRLVLVADTAKDLMAANPISLSESATLRDAAELLTKRGFTAAPVIDAAGRPVGVISQTDLVLHTRKSPAVQAVESETEVTSVDGADDAAARAAGQRLVREVMTPTVYSVPPHASAASVVDQLIALNVHRLFVVDQAGVLVGVISAMDIVRNLR
jgi:CBS domain-containing protein